MGLLGTEFVKMCWELDVQIMPTLSAQLTAEFGAGYSIRILFYMIQFAEVFPDPRIVQSLIGQLIVGTQSQNLRCIASADGLLAPKRASQSEPRASPWDRSRAFIRRSIMTYSRHNSLTSAIIWEQSV